MPEQAHNIGHHVIPIPVWAEAPRYCPGIPFPDYSFVSGQTPHPRTLSRPHLPIDVDAACHSDPHRVYRYGIDLYHYGYLWESHEAWEALWRIERTQNTSLADFLQALIFNSAALLKLRAGSREGAKRHSRKAAARLQRAIRQDCATRMRSFAHLDVVGLVDCLERCHTEITDGQETINTPRLILDPSFDHDPIAPNPLVKRQL